MVWGCKLVVLTVSATKVKGVAEISDAKVLLTVLEGNPVRGTLEDPRR